MRSAYRPSGAAPWNASSGDLGEGIKDAKVALCDFREIGKRREAEEARNEDPDDPTIG